MSLMTRLGFRPAFLDYATMTVYPCDFAGRVVWQTRSFRPAGDRPDEQALLSRFAINF